MHASLKQKIVIVFVCMALFASYAPTAYAAEVYFRVVPSATPHDEAAVVEAYIDPQSADINTLEGVIHLGQEEGAVLSSVLVETGGSVLTWWPTVPTYSKGEQVIRFTGGIPNGFDEPGLLFRMRLFASSPGKVDIAWIGGAAYLNDGEGTIEHISARSLLMLIARGVPNQINAASNDTVPPSLDEIVVGRDDSLYDGKYFLSFHATDDVSGVSRYEVREGGKVTEVLDGVYVLRDQERKTRVDITAYDHAGNSKSTQVPLRYQWIHGIIFISVLFALLTSIGWYVYRKYKYRH